MKGLFYLDLKSTSTTQIHLWQGKLELILYTICINFLEMLEV